MPKSKEAGASASVASSSRTAVPLFGDTVALRRLRERLIGRRWTSHETPTKRRAQSEHTPNAHPIARRSDGAQSSAAAASRADVDGERSPVARNNAASAAVQRNRVASSHLRARRAQFL